LEMEWYAGPSRTVGIHWWTWQTLQSKLLGQITHHSSGSYDMTRRLVLLTFYWNQFNNKIMWLTLAGIL